ncbi:MAG: hypothetical protein AAGA56_31360, partial [Myxococcota bacterium]
MTYRRHRVTELERAVAAALASAGVDAEEAYDGILDPEGLTLALTSGRPILLRAHRPLSPIEDTHTPPPRDPMWLLVQVDGTLTAIEYRSPGHDA